VVNNAAQTVRRPPSFYAAWASAERAPLAPALEARIAQHAARAALAQLAGEQRELADQLALDTAGDTVEPRAAGDTVSRSTWRTNAYLAIYNLKNIDGTGLW